MMGARDRFLAQKGRFREEKVVVQGINDDEGELTVILREMSAAQRADVIESSFDAQSQTLSWTTLYPMMLIACVFDADDGSPIFQPGDEATILALPARPVEQLATAAMLMSGIDEKAVDRAGKGSSKTRNDDSSSS